MEFINRHFDTNGFIEVKLDTLTIDYLWKITKRGLKNKISQELFSRFFKPFYIPLLALIGSLLLIKSKNSHNFSSYKFKIFILGVIIISVSEITTKFYSSSIFESFLILTIPFILFFSLYTFFVKKLNLKTT